LDNATETGKGVEMTLRNTVRKSIAALGMLATAAVPASAADIYGGGLKDQPVYVAAPVWTGFYAGAHVGGAWSELDLNRNFFNEIGVLKDGDGNPLLNGGQPVNGVIFTSPFGGNNLNGSGVFGGGQFGYNWQGGASCCFVFGIEIDIGGADTSIGDHNFFIVNPNKGDDGFGTAAFRVRSQGGGFYGDVTGRLGYVWGSALIYAKGGFAWLNTNFQVDEILTDGHGNVFFNNGNNNNNNTLTGWTLGGGIEYMLGTNWSVKVEYLHFDFSNIENNHCCGDGFFNDFRFFNKDLTVDTVKVGVNYHLHPAPVALPYK
jgi:opacity protein-like surface antigen